MINLTWRCYQALAAIDRKPLPVQNLRKVDNRFIRALSMKRCIQKEGGFIVVSNFGYQVLEEYRRSKMLLRKTETDISESVANLLHLVRMRKERNAA